MGLSLFILTRKIASFAELKMVLRIILRKLISGAILSSRHILPGLMQLISIKHFISGTTTREPVPDNQVTVSLLKAIHSGFIFLPLFTITRVTLNIVTGFPGIPTAGRRGTLPSSRSFHIFLTGSLLLL